MTRLRALLALIILAGLVVPPAAGTPVGSGTDVNNKAPGIANLDVPALVTPVAGGDASVTVTFKVHDANGWQDVQGATVTVYRPDNSTVLVATAAAGFTGDADGAQADYTYTFTMAYHEAPATAENGYVVEVVAEDREGAVSSPAYQRFAYASLAALRLDTGALTFGSVTPGERSATQSLVVENVGNVVIDLETAGAALDDGAGHTIPVDRIRYDVTNGTFAEEHALAADPMVVTGFDLAPGPNATKTTWWLLDVPSGEERYLPAGAYQGAVTLSAVESA